MQEGEILPYTGDMTLQKTLIFGGGILVGLLVCALLSRFFMSSPVVSEQSPSPDTQQTAEELGSNPLVQIEKEVEACIEKDYSTAGMVGCIGKASEQYQEQIVLLSADINAQLDAEQKASFAKANAEWEAFRNAQLLFLRDVYGKAEGTMFRPMSAESASDIYQRRAEELYALREVTYLANGSIFAEDEI